MSDGTRVSFVRYREWSWCVSGKHPEHSCSVIIQQSVSQPASWRTCRFGWCAYLEGFKAVRRQIGRTGFGSVMLHHAEMVKVLVVGKQGSGRDRIKGVLDIFSGRAFLQIHVHLVHGNYIALVVNHRVLSYWLPACSYLQVRST